ncbi:MAG: hypothetical protein L3K17_01425 [Thermoplasmata archaeon]|nr:hypothetical protein [Thermoplasmata archaeon]
MSLQGGANWTSVHLEGYTTGRGPGWKGKEYDFVPSALAVAGIPRKHGLALIGNLEGSLNRLAAAPPPPPTPLPAGNAGIPPPAIASPLPSLIPSQDARRAKDKVRQKQLATVTYSGLAIIFLGFGGQFVLSALGDHAAASAILSLSFVGILLVAVGGFGLISLGNRQMRRPIGTGPVPVASPHPYYASVPFLAPPVPSLPDLAPPPSRAFDLAAEAAAYRHRMRTPVRMRQGMYLYLNGLGIAFIVYSYLRGNLAGGLVLGGFLIAFGLILFVLVGQVDRAPLSITVDQDGMHFEYPKSKRTSIRWTDPKFGVRLSTRSAEVNQNLDPPVSGPTYSLFTGRGSGQRSGPRVLTDIPRECFDLLLQRAQLAGLQVNPRVEGVPGTISERLTYRVHARAPSAGMRTH